MSDRDYLFATSDLSDAIREYQLNLTTEIDNLPAERLLVADDAQVCAHFVGEYTIHPIQLHEDALELLDPREVEIDQYSREWDKTYRRKMLEFRFEIPFSGESRYSGVGRHSTRCHPRRLGWKPTGCFSLFIGKTATVRHSKETSKFS